MVIDWFEQIKDKLLHKILIFDMKDFYQSMRLNLLRKPQMNYVSTENMEKKSQSALKWLSLKETTSLDVNETWHSFSQKVVTSNLLV